MDPDSGVDVSRELCSSLSKTFEGMTFFLDKQNNLWVNEYPSGIYVDESLSLEDVISQTTKNVKKMMATGS